MPNRELYQLIYDEMTKNPALKALSLCRKYNISYSGYRYWIKNHAPKAALTPAIKPTPIRVVPQAPAPPKEKEPSVMDHPFVPTIEEAARRVCQGHDTIEINIHELAALFTPNEMKKFLLLIKKPQLLSQRGSDGKGSETDKNL